VSALPKYLLQDQKAFWTLPFRLNVSSLSFFVPATFASAALVGADTDIERHLPTSSNTVRMAANASTAGALGLVGLGGGMYLLGAKTHNEHQQETGFLVGEAAIDAYATSTALQYIIQRERPFTGNNKGSFFSGGNSFPSNTAAVAWASASVLTREYPGFLTKLLAYGVASGVSAGRVIGEKHWTSDAVIGSALGWYMGRQIYRARSQGPEIDAKSWGTFEKSPEDQQRNPAYMGSTYIPLDSWTYAAFDRLAALGYLPSEILAIRPWPRLEAARLVQEAEETMREAEVPTGSTNRRILLALREEFAVELANLEGAENVGAQLESAYFRLNPIVNQPLRDSFDFGQTIYDDYARPYGQGMNAIIGASGRAEVGPLAFYVRGEYQHSAGMANYSPQQTQQIAAFNLLPIGGVPTFPEQDQFKTIEAYVALNVANWQLSFGQQSLWWGPDWGGSLMLSNNAAPMPMLRISRIVPYTMPGLLAWLGKIRNTFFVGRLTQYNYIRGPFPTFQPLFGNAYQNINPIPYTWGDKLALKMTPNLEIGVSLSVMWAGYGRPATEDSWLHTWNSRGNAQPLDPGKRFTGFNFSYRLPKMRDWVILYADGMANDEPNPIAYYKQSAWNPGLYFPKIPKLNNLDLRVEGVYTNIPNYPGTAPYYSNVHYAQGYVNNKQIIGDWVGRQGDGIQAWTTYWFSGRNKMEVGYRRQWVDPLVLGGGNLNDFSSGFQWAFKRTLGISSSIQYERWNFPLLSNTSQSNVSMQIGLTLWPIHSAMQKPH